MKELLAGVRDLGYEKPRAALALLALAFFGVVYFLISLNAPPGWGPAFGALSACYLVAFLALASEAFWARWFASGLGWSGMMVGIASLVMVGWQPVLGIYTGLHTLIVLMLLGPKMAARFDHQPDWRTRFDMDEFGVQRVRKAVTRGSAALPSLIVWALAPKEGAGMMIAAIVAATLGMAGLVALVRLRAWSVLALGGATVAAAVGALLPVLVGDHIQLAALSGVPTMAVWLLVLAVSALAWLPATLAPLVGPAWRYLRTPR